MAAFQVQGNYIYRLISANTDNPTVVTQGPTNLMAILWYSVGSGGKFVKIYDKDTTPTILDTPILTARMSGATTSSSVAGFPTNGIFCEDGLSFRLTADVADNDNTAVSANDIWIWLIYQIV